MCHTYIPTLIIILQPTTLYHVTPPLLQVYPVPTRTQPLLSPMMAARHSHQQPQLEFPHLPPEWRDRYKKGQMHRFRDQLMKLPVPPLQQTLEKYIASVEVCLLQCTEQKTLGLINNKEILFME